MAMQGKEFRAIRARLGVTQIKLARALGLSSKYIGMMENDDPGAKIEPRTEFAMRYLAEHPDAVG